MSDEKYEHRAWWEGDADLQTALDHISRLGWRVVAAWPTSEDLGENAYVQTGVRMILQRPHVPKEYFPKEGE
jgi:hypothetical protein